MAMACFGNMKSVLIKLSSASTNTVGQFAICSINGMAAGLQLTRAYTEIIAPFSFVSILKDSQLAILNTSDTEE